MNGINGTGTRDSVTGVCTCKNIPTIDIDTVCNQGCRESAPKITFTSLTTVSIANGNATVNFDLSQIADVYGTPNIKGNVKSVSITPNGFFGSYELPPIL